MPTNWPTSLDDGTSLPTKADGDDVTSAETNTQSGAIKAVEATIGVPASPAAGSTNYKLANHTHDGTQSESLAVAVGSSFALKGIISPAQIVADQNNYTPTSFATSSVLRIFTDASRNITGLVAGATGKIMLVQNIGSFPIVLKTESASSTAANRFGFGASDITISAGRGMLLFYDLTLTRWTTPGTAVTAHSQLTGIGVDDHHTQIHARAQHTTAIRVSDEGGAFTDILDLDFVGAGVAATFASGKATVTITGGGAGGAPTTATYVTMTADGTLSNEQLLSGILMRGTLAARATPASSPVPSYYYTTDTKILYQNDGTTWQEIANDHAQSHADADHTGANKTAIYDGGTLRGTEPATNFITGAGIALTIADNSGAGRVDVTPATTIFAPSDHGLIAWPVDPTLVTGVAGITAGVLQLVRVPLRVAALANNYYVRVVTAGATVANAFIGLYTTAGALVASSGSADQSTTFQSTGIKTIATGAANISLSAASYYWIGLLVGSAGTLPIFGTIAANVMANVGLTAATYRYGTTGTALTALPASFTPSGIASPSGVPWLGIG